MNERKQFFKNLWVLMLPIAFQNLMATLVSATDSLVLAVTDQYSVAAVSLAGEISFVMHLFFDTVIGSISIMTAQYMGKGDARTVKNLLSMSLRYNFVIAFVFFIGAYFFPELLMRIYTPDPNLIAIGAEYLRIVSWSFLLCSVSHCYLCTMKASGGAAAAAVIAVATAVVDLGVDIILVNWLKIGAKGTAYSTLAVNVVEFLGVILYSHRKNRIHPDLESLRHSSPELSSDFRKLSLPVLISSLVWGIGYSLSAAVMGHVGTDTSSAYSIATLIRGIFTCFMRGLGAGAGIIVGKDLGSGNIELAKRDGARLSKASVICGALSGLLFFFLAPLISQFFVLNDAARAYLNQMIPICSVYLFGLSITTTTITNIFPAGGDTRFDAQLTAITMWLITLPLACLAAFVFKLPVIFTFIALSLDELVKILFIYPRYKKYLWLKDLTREFDY